MQPSRYGYTNITSEYLIYPFSSPIKYNVNYTGTFSKYSIIDKFYANSLVKPVKRLYYGGVEWSYNPTTPSLTFSVSNLAYSFADEIIFKSASMPGISVDIPDVTYDRIDAIVVNEEGQIKVNKGVASTSPKKPVIAEDEVLLQYALIKNASHPNANRIGTSEIVYEKVGSGWNTGTYQTSGAISGSVDFSSTVSPYTSTHCIKVVSDYRTGLNFFKEIGSMVRADYGSLSMRVRLNNQLDENRYLSVSIYGTSSNYVGTASSNTINLMAHGLERDAIGQWQHIVVPTIKFGSKVENVKGVKFRMIGGASASNTSWDMDWIVFQTGVDYDEYTDPSNASYTTTTITNTGGGGGGGGGTSLAVQDYLTQEEFPDISKIIFRGNTVVVNQQPTLPGLTATGVLVTQQIPNQVVVWIPAPNYANPLSPTIDNSGFDRYVSLPATASYTQSVAPGTFGTGDWSVSSNFTTSTTRKTKNSTSFSPFASTSAFTVNNNASTQIKLEVFKEDEATAIRTITKTINITNFGSTTNTFSTDDSGLSGLTLTLGQLQNDQDKFKIANTAGGYSINTSLVHTTVFPNGGRFKCRLTHTNGVDGTITSQTNTLFYDSDGTSTSAIIGTVSFDEKTAVTRQFSGIHYYNLNSQFSMTASGIDMINEITFPSAWKQIDFLPNQYLAMTNSVAPMTGASSLDGHSDGTKASLGNAITGWGINWNKSGLTFSRVGYINLSNNRVPGFVTNLNQLQTSASASVASRLFDYTNPSIGYDYNMNSPSRRILLDTYSEQLASISNNPIEGETNRLSFNSVFGNGSAAFNSTAYLGSAPNTGELQYIFGRIIYPQHDFRVYMPYLNNAAGADYSALSGYTQTYTNTLTKNGVDLGTSATSPNTLTDYRWFVTSYSKASSFTNGYFTFGGCNWTEADLHCQLGSAGVTGNEHLVIIVGYSSDGLDTLPDRFLFVSGESSTWGGRNIGTTYYLNSSGTRQIGFTKGGISTSTKKIWLFIGYKNTTRGKELFVGDITATL